MLERSDQPVEKRKIRLLECMKYKIITLLCIRRFKAIQVRERFVYEEFTEALHELQRGSYNSAQKREDYTATRTNTINEERRAFKTSKRIP